LDNPDSFLMGKLFEKVVD